MAEEQKISKEHEDLLKPFANEIKAIKESRPEGEWMVNLAHYMGFQWAEWQVSRGMANGRLILQPKASHESARVVENRIMPAVNKMVAVVMSNIRVPLVRPPHGITIQERNRVETSNALLRELSMPWELDDTAHWELFVRILCLTGTAFDWEYWNPKAGKMYGSVSDEVYNAGKHDREVLQPFDVFPQMHVTNMHKMRHITVRRLTDIDEIKAHYGVTVKGDPNISCVRAADWQIRTLSSPYSTPQGSEKSQFVYVTMVRPTEKNPDGHELHWTMMNEKPDRVLFKGPNQNPNGELQVAMMSFAPVGPGWSTSPTSQLRLNNLAYNSLLSSQIQMEKNALHQILLTPNDSKISEADLTERTRSQISVVHYDSDGGVPTPLAVRTSGNSGFRILDQLDKGAADIMFQHESMSGQVQGQIRSQPAVQEVRETDLLPLQPMIERLRTMVGEVGGWRLAMARKWFTESRTATVMSDSNEWKAFDFTKSNLSKSTQLYIPQEASLPLSLDGKLNAIGKIQAIDPNNTERLNAMFSELFHIDRISSVASLERDHRESQREEIEVLLTGNVIPVNVYDNDGLHMDELDRYRNRSRKEFKALPPIIQAAFQDHHDAHKSALMDKMVEEAEFAQLQAIASGQVEPEQGQEQPAEPVAAGAEG